VSATTLYGDGSNLTGVAMSIAPISYNPDVNDTLANRFGTGIGITFTERIIAGSGNLTLRIAGAAGTVVENFGVGSSVTIANNTVSFTPTADLAADTVYHINYPSGAFTNTGGDVSYVGTAYTFAAGGYVNQLWMWGRGHVGQLGQNDIIDRSSPVQIPGTTWNQLFKSEDRSTAGMVTKTDGTLWVWGNNNIGQLAQNNTIRYSSPVQIPGTTWNSTTSSRGGTFLASKTDGTLWVWGNNDSGSLGQNQSPGNLGGVSSPIQVPGTTWGVSRTKISGAGGNARAVIKTDGTLWIWGANQKGQLGLNQPESTAYSSPVQIPGTTWSTTSGSYFTNTAIKTDGTLWCWGWNSSGKCGQNEASAQVDSYSSPVQVPGTWSQSYSGPYHVVALKTNGTLWNWGWNGHGQLGQNSGGYISSPVQVPGTWSSIAIHDGGVMATKADNTLWTWGENEKGQLGDNSRTNRSSPVQVPGTWSLLEISGGSKFVAAMKQV